MRAGLVRLLGVARNGLRPRLRPIWRNFSSTDTLKIAQSILYDPDPEADPKTVFGDAFAALNDITSGTGERDKEVMDKLVGVMEQALSEMPESLMARSSLLRAYMSSNNYHKAVNLAEQVVREIPEESDESKVTWRIWFSASCAMGDTVNAMIIRSKMERKGVRMNNSTFSYLCRALVQTEEYEDLDFTIREAKQFGAKMDISTHRAIFDAYCSQSDLNKAIGQLKTIKRRLPKNAEIPAGVISQLVSTLWIPHEITYAFRKLKQDKIEVPRDVYEDQVERFASSGRMEDAAQFFNTILSLKHKPTHRSVEALIQGYLNNGLEKIAIAMYDTLRAQGIDAGASTRKRIMEFYLNIRDFKTALQVVKDMIADGDILDEDLLHIVLSILVRENQVDLALNAIGSLRPTGISVTYYYQCTLIAVARDLSMKISTIVNERAKQLAINTAYNQARKIVELSECPIHMGGPMILLHAAAGSIDHAEGTVRVLEERGDMETANEYGLVDEALAQLYLKMSMKKGIDSKEVLDHFENAINAYARLSQKTEIRDYRGSNLAAMFARPLCIHINNDKICESLLDLGVWFYTQAVQAKKKSYDFKRDTMPTFVNPQDDILEDAIVEFEEGEMNFDGPTNAGVLPVALHYGLRSIATNYFLNQDILESEIYGDGIDLLYNIDDVDKQSFVEFNLMATRPPLQYTRTQAGVQIPRAFMISWVHEYASSDFRTNIVKPERSREHRPSIDDRSLEDET
ncbi:hypothetical protein AAMO2058_000662400 [Amorphochlora amoebiformis]